MAKRKTKSIHHKVVHHAKHLYRITPKFIHGMGIGAFVGIIVVMSFGPILPAHALSLNSPRDCDSNAVIKCGALSTTELKNSYNNTSYKGVQALYSQFGISKDDIADIGDTAQAGRVYKTGEVKIGDTTVATDAITAGREYITGSTKVSAGDTTFYTRPPKVSFRIESIAAFVVMEKGKFKYAILAACGNPVKATPKVLAETPKPEPEPDPKPKPDPKPEPKQETRSSTRSSLLVTASTQTPESTPLPPEVKTAATLPETGPGDIGFVVCLAIVGGYIYHVTHRHIRRRRASRVA